MPVFNITMLSTWADNVFVGILVEIIFSASTMEAEKSNF